MTTQSEGAADPEQSAITQKIYELFVSAVRSQPTPPTLFHYTDSAGFKGIIEGGFVRATHVAFMNDATEYLHGVQHLHEKVINARKRQRSAIEHELLQDIETNLAATRPENFYPQFVACFSAAENSLSQWRAYGGGEGAFSIGFSSADLSAAARRINALFCRVIYDRAEQAKLLQDLLDWAIQEYSSRASPLKPADRPKHRAQWLLKFFRVAAQVAPMMKNPSFAEEHEWRLIQPMFRLADIGFVPKQAGLVPFAKFLLGVPQVSPAISNPQHVNPLPDRLPVTVLWAGPGRFKEISLLAAQGLLGQCNYNSVTFRTSDIPYRVT